MFYIRVPPMFAASQDIFEILKSIAIVSSLIVITSWPPHPIHYLMSEEYQA